MLERQNFYQLSIFWPFFYFFFIFGRRVSVFVFVRLSLRESLSYKWQSLYLVRTHSNDCSVVGFLFPNAKICFILFMLFDSQRSFYFLRLRNIYFLNNRAIEQVDSIFQAPRDMYNLQESQVHKGISNSQFPLDGELVWQFVMVWF